MGVRSHEHIGVLSLALLAVMSAGLRAQDPIGTAARAERASLHARVLTPSGVSLWGVFIEVSSDGQQLFEERMYPRAKSTGQQQSDEFLEQTGHWHTRKARKTILPATFGIVLPDVPFYARVLDDLGRELARFPQEPLRPGEERSLDLQLAAEPSGLRVRVLDREGRPIVGAEVELFDRGSSRRLDDRFTPTSMSAITGPDGDCSFARLAPEPVELRVWRSGHRVLSQRVEAFPVDDAPLVVRIDRDRTVTVRVVNDAGKVWSAQRVTIFGTHGEVWRLEPASFLDLGDSGWEADGVPPGEHVIEVQTASNGIVRVQSVLDAITVPATHGTGLLVEWGASFAAELGGITSIDLFAEDGTPISRRGITAKEASRRFAIIAATPGPIAVRVVGPKSEWSGTTPVEIRDGTITRVEFSGE